MVLTVFYLTFYFMHGILYAISICSKNPIYNYIGGETMTRKHKVLFVVLFLFCIIFSIGFSFMEYHLFEGTSIGKLISIITILSCLAFVVCCILLYKDMKKKN